MPNTIINPSAGDRYALRGRIVTMNEPLDVVDDGLLYIQSGVIMGVLPVNASPPPGFENCFILNTGGTIYPGLIELHNHLSYNILPPWNVPQPFTNRGQWGKVSDYRKCISGPMGILGQTPGYVEAIVRYVECKCLLSGVTTSQGIALASNQGIQKYYRGITRNVEEPDHADLPKASTKISDVAASDVEKFFKALKREKTCLLLHLSEGIDEKARHHFTALQMENGQWAITPALAGIHSAGLNPEDFAILQAHGGSMVWSPLSNFLLYGDTAKIKAAKEAGVTVALGSDWSPSGSKNLLGELKVAKLVSDQLGTLFTDAQIVAMATRNAAKILKWDTLLGSLEPNKLADLLVVKGKTHEPYQHLFKSTESAVYLVVINGVPRYGLPRLMKPFGPGTETWKVGNSNRVLNLKQTIADPVIGALTLKTARERLVDGMKRLPELAIALENRDNVIATGATRGSAIQWSLVLDHEDMEDQSQRHFFAGPENFLPAGDITVRGASVPLSSFVSPISLDPLTVVDDPDFLPQLTRQINLPQYIKTQLPKGYKK